MGTFYDGEARTDESILVEEITCVRRKYRPLFRRLFQEQLITYYRSARNYYVGRLSTLDQTFNIVLEEHFGHEPVKFE